MAQVLFIDEQDFPYEEDLARNPSSLKPWFSYFEHKQRSPQIELFYLYERALLEFPTSYKLWKAYLDSRRDYVLQNHLLFDREADFANNCYERSLIFLNKMPRIWLDYGEFLLKQGKIHFIRKLFDRAIRSLPIMQHDRIWNKYSEFAQLSFVPTKIGVRIMKRYVQFDKKKRESFVGYLMSRNEFNEAAIVLSTLLDDPDFEPTEFSSKSQMLKEFCKMVCEHSTEISSLNVERFLRSCLNKFRDMSGIVWCSIANYFILQGNFVNARSIFEEGMNSVNSVKDFSLIYDAYYKLEEKLLETYFCLADEGQPVDEIEMELLSLRIQRLLDDREILISDAYLRKNPNNVFYWERRMGLFFNNTEKLLSICKEAISCINPKKAIGNLSKIWIKYAQLQLTSTGSLANAREIFERALQVDFKTDQDLAQVWIAYSELELENGTSFDHVSEMLKRALTPIKRTTKEDSNESSEFNYFQLNLYKNWSLWSFYLDLLEMRNDIDSVCYAYDKVIELKICTCQTIVNYAYFMERAVLIEESFRIYERGIELFGYPVAFELWNIYLPKFVLFFEGRKLERLRDLFEQALENCPADYLKCIYIFYGLIEEQYGLIRNAMQIYNRAANAVQLKDKKELFLFYIARAADLYGISATREVFELAISALPDKQVREMCLLYAEVENKLEESERARCIFIHGAQFANPNVYLDYWEAWNRFELEHGNQDTFREMLRVKRVIETKYSSMLVIQKPALTEAPEFVPAKSH